MDAATTSGRAVDCDPVTVRDPSLSLSLSISLSTACSAAVLDHGDDSGLWRMNCAPEFDLISFFFFCLVCRR